MLYNKKLNNKKMKSQKAEIESLTVKNVNGENIEDLHLNLLKQESNERIRQRCLELVLQHKLFNESESFNSLTDEIINRANKLTDFIKYGIKED